MVFKGLNLARLSLTKAFTHGSAQSFVAASQSSYAAQNSPFATLTTSFTPWQPKALSSAQLGFNQAFTQSNPNSRTQNDQHDSLAAFLASWNKHQRLVDSDIQYKHPHRWIDRKKGSSNVDLGSRPKFDASTLVIEEEAVIFEDDIKTPPPSRRQSFARSYSSGHLEELRKSNAEPAASRSESFSDALTPVHPSSQLPSQSTFSVQPNYQRVTDQTQPTEASLLPIVKLFPQEQNILHLAGSGQFSDIPEAFDQLLASGHIPSVASYNALLRAVAASTESRSEAALKAQHVYFDMLQRNVTPDSTTLTVLIDLFSTRSLEVCDQRLALENARAQYALLTSSGPTGFPFASQELQYSSLVNDDSLTKAIDLFDLSSPTVFGGFPERTYHLLISSCAKEKRIDDMIRVYSQMELRHVNPQPATFIAMINAFASVGDLRSAVDTYNEYKSMAIENDNGELEIERRDHDIYVAIVRAYYACGRPDGGETFADKVLESVPPSSRPYIRDSLDFQAVFPFLIESGQLSNSLERARHYSVLSIKQKALSLLAVKAADANNADVAAQAFDSIPDRADLFLPAVALCALHLRAGNIAGAESYWNCLESSVCPAFSDPIQTSTLYSLALVKCGQPELGLQMARKLFHKIRDSYAGTGSESQVACLIDDAIRTLSESFSASEAPPSLISILELMRLMIDNDGLLASVAVNALAHIDSDCLAVLEIADLSLVAQVQAGLILSGSGGHDVADSARLAAIVTTFVSSGAQSDGRSTKLVATALSKLNNWTLLRQWESLHTLSRADPQSCSVVALPSTNPDPSADIYALTTDNTASVAITEILESSILGPAARLEQALSRYRELRKTGRHPRYYVYAKLITEAANLNKFHICQDVLASAYQDIPPQPQFKVVKHGWSTILDSMIVACLNTGNRKLADVYHAELLGMGSSPTANTFGLYITTLKETSHTLDEASEALKIFARAQSEGVEPTSFLYNALIGKLGKARRIDDCLYYFNEMRSKGIRPTSVTYGTIINALCRVSDEKYAEELFSEMEASPNYKPRPAPYHSMMQFFLATKRDRSKVLGYYDRMIYHGIRPTTHTYKLLIDTFATITPVDMASAEQVLDQIRNSGSEPDVVHYAALIHAKGCVLRDLAGAQALFDKVVSDGVRGSQACLYQALFESMVANHAIEQSEAVVELMNSRGVEMTPYVANSLIHGWSLVGQVFKAESIFRQVPLQKREPSTYDSMARAFMLADDRDGAIAVVNEALSRGYPAAVANKLASIVNLSPNVASSAGLSPSA